MRPEFYISQTFSSAHDIITCGMEFDHSLMFNFLSIFGTILFTLATSITIFVKLRKRWPVTVNCWFCNNNVKVQSQEIHWWVCSSCEQYNGFTKDGDYSYDIPERYGLSIHNSTRYCIRQTRGNETYCTNNNLCYQCNRNEEFKLSELRRFESASDKHYDTEVKQLKNSLEEKYPLCKKCKISVQNMLRTQARWLTQYKMLFFRQRAVQNIVTNKKASEGTFRGLSFIFAAILAYNHRWLLLPVCGLLLQICTCWANSMRKMTYDIVLLCLWCCTIVIVICPGIQISSLNTKTSTFLSQYITQRNMILQVAFIIGLMNTLYKSYGRKSVKSIHLKRIKHNSPSPISEDSLSADLNISSEFEDDRAFDTAPITTFRNLKTPTFPSPTPLSPEAIHAKPIQSSIVLTSTSNSKQQTFNCPAKIVQTSTYWLNDSVTTLSALSLSETQSKCISRSPKMFEKRIYGTGCSSDLFKKLNVTGRRHILSPPKLKSVLQTSWVAGGYWQGGMDTPSLSRSSSQSSGFGSGGSNFASSREASVHEFDRCSVISDATQSYCWPKSVVSSYQTSSTLYYPPSSNSAQDHRSFVQQHDIQAPSQFQNSISTRNNGLNAPPNQKLFSVSKSREAPVCSNHTTTIVTTSPIWLSTLLCCSVLLNAIVLCTTFLR